MSTMRHYRRFLLLMAMLSAATSVMAQTDWDRYLGMTAVMTQVPVGYLIQCHFTFHSNLII